MTVQMGSPTSPESPPVSNSFSQLTGGTSGSSASPSPLLTSSSSPLAPSPHEGIGNAVSYVSDIQSRGQAFGHGKSEGKGHSIGSPRGSGGGSSDDEEENGAETGAEDAGESAGEDVGASFAEDAAIAAV
jgi:hypothetical protein